jgi:hypothetical protein
MKKNFIRMKKVISFAYVAIHEGVALFGVRAVFREHENFSLSV